MASWTTTVVVPGPREQVFALFADRSNYGAIVAPVSGTLLRPGPGDPQGPGAVHRIGIGPIGLTEQIVSLTPGRSFTYRAVTPLPVRHYIGVVEFRDHPRGTRVDYTLDVEAAVPMPGALLAPVVKALAGGLARGATRRLRRAAQEPTAA